MRTSNMRPCDSGAALFLTRCSALTRRSCEKCNCRPSISVQRSNQLSYKVQLSSSNHKFLHECIYSGSCRCQYLPNRPIPYLSMGLADWVNKLSRFFDQNVGSIHRINTDFKRTCFVIGTLIQMK